MPGNASEALQRMTELARQSEQTNEALLNAQIEMGKKVDALKAAQAKQAADHAAVAAAQARVAQFQPAIDRVARASYEGARTSRLFAVLTADSPQQLLDQMTALDVLSSETAKEVWQYQQAVADAATVEDQARQSADAARDAAAQAQAFSDDLQKKQSELQTQMAAVTQAWGQLSGRERAVMIGTPFPPGFDPNVLLRGLVPGSQTSALQAGLSRIGDPYVWGATGPNAFDCSGLVQWAYKQVGKQLPRTSQAQGEGGVPVRKEDLQPGDVVLFYPDHSHVGIYAGDGMVLHASTFGVPVQVVPMATMPYAGARRY
ncbi:NlpC/P60 family protein [Skermania sp. ID1734]|nr:C40 family peptidase [Skermania sp. ID1734]TSE01284.1 NlpC/P60 family protein [Skermania sp. ID1734]